MEEEALMPFKVLGRRSVDIVKSGGYKVSALDVERVLLAHPAVKEVAVLGVPDATLGEVVAAVIAFKGEAAATPPSSASSASSSSSSTTTTTTGAGTVVSGGFARYPSLEELREWAKDECASYQFPRIMTTVEELPKNAMGKVNKKDLLRTFFA